jgi:hypothetical protein
MFLLSREKKKISTLSRRLQRYSKITDIEAAVVQARQEMASAQAKRVEIETQLQPLEARRTQLIHTVNALRDTVDLAEVGHYDLVEDLESSETYRVEIEQLKDRQKQMLKAGQATVANKTWKIDGSAKEGQKLIDHAAKMALRAFNNECEVIIARVTWKNHETAQERILKSAIAIDKLNESSAVTLAEPYIGAKLKELEAAYRERLAHQRERERLKEEREAAREEEKAQRELQAAIKRAEKDEDAAAAAINRARAEAAQAAGSARAVLEQRIQMLEEKLRQAHQAKERAQSMAEQTRVGHVYVISNYGAFGKDVFKIGMTRRVDPLDRVRELGDASVPFPFDVHVLTFTDDAPKLEREIHVALAPYRVNRINDRKEFFRVPQSQLKETLRRKLPNAHFVDSPFSEDLVKTIAIRKEEAARRG